MKKIIGIFVLTVLFMSSGLSFAEETKATAVKPAKKTIFNAISNYLSTLDRPFTRPGNKQGFWNATADWMRGINKE
ncbi:MAG: hypothetical protein WCY36_02140 [Candidatus Omnitrophota bacterium]